MGWVLRGMNLPFTPHRSNPVETGEESIAPSAQLGQTEISPSTIQDTLESRGTFYEWQPQTTSSLPWCSSRKFTNTRSTSRSPFMVSLAPPGTRILVMLEEKRSVTPSPQCALHPRSGRQERGLSTEPLRRKGSDALFTGSTIFMELSPAIHQPSWPQGGPRC